MEIVPYPEETTFEQWSRTVLESASFDLFQDLHEKGGVFPCSELKAEWVRATDKGLSLNSSDEQCFFKPKKIIKTLIPIRLPTAGQG